VRAGFREADGFEIRYWRPRDLRRAFWRIGDVTLSADGFFTLNPQVSDLDLLAPRARAVVRTSSALQALSRRFPPLAAAADSLWVRAVKR